jgi:hypothetical protein
MTVMALPMRYATVPPPALLFHSSAPVLASKAYARPPLVPV